MGLEKLLKAGNRVMWQCPNCLTPAPNRVVHVDEQLLIPPAKTVTEFMDWTRNKATTTCSRVVMECLVCHTAFRIEWAPPTAAPPAPQLPGVKGQGDSAVINAVEDDEEEDNGRT